MKSFDVPPRDAVRWEAIGDEVLVLDADATHVHRLSGDTARAAQWALTHLGDPLDDAPDELRALIGALIDTGIIPASTVVDTRVRWSRRRLITLGSAGVGVVSLALPSSAAAASGDGVVDPNDTAPQTVGVISVTAGVTTLSLSWVDLGEISYYTVYYRPVAADHSTTASVSVPGGSVVLANLTPATDYEIWIVSYNDRGPSAASATVTRSTLSPQSPTGTSADTTTTTITFSWNAVSGAAEYRVTYWRTGHYVDRVSVQPSPLNATSLTVTNLFHGEQYSWYVQSKVNGQWSTAPTESQADQNAVTTDLSAASVALTPGPTYMLVEWAAVTNATAYQVLYKLSSAASFTSAGSTSSLSTTITGLVPNTSYDVYVVASNTLVTAPASATITASTVVVPAVGIPSVTAGVTTLDVSWSAVSVNGTPTYTVYYRAGSSGAGNPLSATSSTSAQITGLTPDTSYEVWVVTTLGGYNSSASPTRTVSTSVVPAPDQPSATATTVTSLTIGWTAVAGSPTYEVFYRTGSNSYASAGTTSSTSLTISSLVPNTSYDFYVTASIGGKTSAASTSNSATTAAPTAPDQPTVTVTFDSASVSWTAVSGASSYEVFYRTGSDSYASAGATASTSLTVSSLTPGTAYDFYVTTIISGVSSSASTTRSATTASQSALSGATQSSLTATWTAVSGATGYEVFARTGANAYTSRGTVGSATLTLTFSSLIPDSSYDVYVVATLASGSSTSNTRSASTSAVTAPGAPTLSAVTTTGLTATWTAVSGVTGYQVFYKAAADSGYTSAGTTTAPTVTLAISGLVPSTTYTVYVVATLSGKSSAAGTTASATTSAPTAPGQPAVTVTFDGASVSWTAVSGASSYEVFYRTGSDSYASAGTTASTSLTVSSLTPGTAYDFYVTTIISGVSSSASTTRSATVASQSALSGATQSGLTATWTAVSGATGYEVFARTGANSYTSRGTTAAGTLTLAITSLVPETSYDVYVVATLASGSSTSNTRSATTSAVTTPAAPTISNPSITTTGFTVSWTAVAGVTGYEVFYKTAAASSYTSAGTTTAPTVSLAVSGLTPNTAYTVYVVATLSGKSSAASPTTSATTATPATPGRPTVTTAFEYAVVSWTAVSGVSTYEVFYRVTGTTPYTSAGTTSSTSMTVGSLASATSYDFVVASVVSGVNSANSQVRAGTTASQTALTGATTTALTVNWSAVTNATGYEVFARTGANAYTSRGTALAAATSLTISSLIPSSSYDVYVVATVATGNSTSNVQTASTLAITAPGAPTLSAVTATGLTATWTAVGGVTGYQVFYKAAADASYTSAGTTTAPTVTLAVTGLVPSTAYTVYVVATLSGKSSAAGTTASATTLAPTAPGQPTAAVTFDSATISWTAVSGASSYEVFYRTGVAAYASAGTTSSTSLTVSSLTPGTAYDFYVTTIISGVSSAASTVRTATIATQSALSGATQSSLTANWTAVSGATGYEVFARTGANAYTSRGTTAAGVLTLTFSSLIPDTSYDVYVVATLASGSSTSNTRSGRTTVVTAPGAPTLSSITTTGLTATWTAVSGVTSYEVFYKAAADSSYTSAGTTTAPTVTLAITGLTPGVTYTVYVTASLSGKTSAAGTTASATTLLPTAPGAPTVTTTFTTAAVSWTAVSGVTSYEVFYRTGAAAFASAGTTDSTSLSITGLTVNTSYDFYVKSILLGVSSAAGTTTTTSTGSLAAPTAGVTSLACSWTAVSGATGYEVWARTGANSFTKRSTDPLTATTFTITGLTTEVAYDVYVIAVLAGGNQTSNTRSATTLAIATGGTRVADGNFWVHTFTAAGNFVLNTAATVDYLIVGGGGGGSRGGGGGGGVISATATSLSAATYAVTVGSGGTAGSGTLIAGNGGTSSFNSSTAGGGGGGGSKHDGAAGAATNGSGGGGGDSAKASQVGGAKNGTGGTGGDAPGTGLAGGGLAHGGGGGGANGNGTTSSLGTGGNGGAALSSSITGTALTYAGGGRGGGDTANGTSGNGTANYGDGGNGINTGVGATGKAGVVIIRYSKTPSAAPPVLRLS